MRANRVRGDKSRGRESSLPRDGDPSDRAGASPGLRGEVEECHEIGALTTQVDEHGEAILAGRELYSNCSATPAIPVSGPCAESFADDVGGVRREANLRELLREDLQVAVLWIFLVPALGLRRLGAENEERHDEERDENEQTIHGVSFET